MARDPTFLVSPPASSLRRAEITTLLQRLAGADAKHGPPQPTEAMVRAALEAPHDATGPAIGRHGFPLAEAERIYRERYAMIRGAYEAGQIRDPSVEGLRQKRAMRATFGITPADAVRAGQNHLIVSGLVNLATLATDLHRQGFSREQIRAAFLDADRSGLWELQADAGLGRFTREQLDLLPPGPRGTALTSARILREPAPSKPATLDRLEAINRLAGQKNKEEKMAAKQIKKQEAAERKAAEREAKKAQREAMKKAKAAEREAKKAEAAREKAAQKAAAAAQKAAQREASQREKKAAAAAARQAKKEAKKQAELAALKVNEAARAAVVAAEAAPDFEVEEWEKIPFTTEALIAASPEDARKLLGRAGKGQRAALRRQLRGELRALREQIRMLKKAQKQRIKTIRARCRDAARQIRERMRKLREEFLRAWKELKAEDAERRQVCSSDLKLVMEEIGPALASAAQRQARIYQLAGEIARMSPKRQITKKMIEARENRADALARSDNLVRMDLEHHMRDVFPQAVKWWDLKGVKMAELKPNRIPERVSRSEKVMEYVQENMDEIMRFLADEADREIKRKEAELKKKQKELEAQERRDRRRQIQRSVRRGRMAGRSLSREQIDARRRQFYEPAPF